MIHKPTLSDAAADLKRCIYASFSSLGLNDPNVTVFLSHAFKIINQYQVNRDDPLLKIVKKSLDKVRNFGVDPAKAREDLLMAVVLLQSMGTQNL